MAEEPSMHFITPQSRGRGRPAGSTRVDEPRKSVATWLPASEHDRLIRAANAREMSISQLIRQVLILRLP